MRVGVTEYSSLWDLTCGSWQCWNVTCDSWHIVGIWRVVRDTVFVCDMWFVRVLECDMWFVTLLGCHVWFVTQCHITKSWDPQDMQLQVVHLRSGYLRHCGSLCSKDVIVVKHPNSELWSHVFTYYTELNDQPHPPASVLSTLYRCLGAHQSQYCLYRESTWSHSACCIVAVWNYTAFNCRCERNCQISRLNVTKQVSTVIFFT